MIMATGGNMSPNTKDFYENIVVVKDAVVGDIGKTIIQ